MNNIEIIKKENGPSGRMYVEKYVRSNYSEIYEDIINYCNINNLTDLPFKEKVYHYVNDIKHHIYCENPNCNNLVNFKNSTIGYYKYCSIACISCDPKIKKIKEEKSYEKYGTKAPGMNSEIIKKTINTNIERYGGNSPKNNINVIKKSNIKFRETKKNNLIQKYDNVISVDYENKKIYYKCENNHICDMNLYIFQNRKKLNTIICTICNPIDSHISGQEILLQQFIKEKYNGDILLNDRHIGKELDVYLPDLKLAFEFNGIYWHNELYRSSNYHLEKTELCEKNGIKLIHIYQDDWTYKEDIVKSRIINILNLTQNKIFARKCEIKEITDNNLIRSFLEDNHIQGFIGSQVKIGLFYDNELVSLMTFGKQRKNMGIKSEIDTFELLRFCNKLNTNVVGGASKLFNHFIKNYNPKEIITYADRSWSNGNLYKQLGFELVHKTQPNYYYIVDGIRKNRFNYRKDILIKDGFDPNKSEHEIMLERKIYRIYDSGHLKFIWKSYL
jgi:hypothetical protein